jgi:hypothetical protein
MSAETFLTMEEPDLRRMRCVDSYDYGYEKARSGPFWETKLPQIEAAKEAAKTTEH